ncbi:unnamed protein product [Adineta steineri]|uniref:BZIP domain-containing protein n=1 Tax=Adineta steineri TaxID=433720 RepID=A0A814XHK5_9BILA|nr:unnamed protein product [Adineta steineri]
MTTSIQKMQSNDFLRSSTSPFIETPQLLPGNLQSQLNMLYALTQQQQQQISPSDLKTKRIKKSMPLPNEPPTQVPLISATDSSCLNSMNDREIVKVVTTAGPQCVDKDFLTQLLTRKDVIPARKRRDFIPNDMKDDHYWERRRKNNLAAKRSREKRRLNDIVLGMKTKVVELSNENETLKAKLHLMLSRLNMKETEMENIFEEEQRLGHICLKPATSASALLAQNDSDNDDEYSSHEDSRSMQQPKSNDNTAIDLSRTEVKTGNLLRKSPSPLTFEEEQRLGHICLKPATSASALLAQNDSDNDDEYSSHEDSRSMQQPKSNDNTAIDLSRTEVKTGNLLRKSPSPLTPSPSPPNESLLQILANQMFKTKPQETLTSSSRLLTIASPPDIKPLKRNFNQLQEDTEQQQKWDDAAMALLSLNKPQPTPPVEQQVALQSVINGLLRKPNPPPKATIDYHSQQNSSENFHHHHTSFDQWKNLMNYFSTPPSQLSTMFNTNMTQTQQQPQNETRGDMMPLKLRMKMLNAKS